MAAEGFALLACGGGEGQGRVGEERGGVVDFSICISCDFIRIEFGAGMDMVDNIRIIGENYFYFGRVCSMADIVLHLCTYSN